MATLSLDLEALHRKVIAFMSKTRSGEEPTIEEMTQAMGDRF